MEGASTYVHVARVGATTHGNARTPVNPDLIAWMKSTRLDLDMRKLLRRTMAHNETSAKSENNKAAWRRTGALIDMNEHEGTLFAAALLQGMFPLLHGAGVLTMREESVLPSVCNTSAAEQPAAKRSKGTPKVKD
jgi:hypothetical protein